MNPQPPVTRMRMAARTSSAERNALVESAPAPARASDYLQRWKVRFEGTDWVPWLILALAAFLRFFLLGIKPPHFDEGINGWFVDQVMKNGFYRYDPTNYHGPLHFYVLVLFAEFVWPESVGDTVAGRAGEHRLCLACFEVRAGGGPKR